MSSSNPEMRRRAIELQSQGDGAKALELCLRLLQDSFDWEAARLAGGSRIRSLGEWFDDASNREKGDVSLPSQ